MKTLRIQTLLTLAALAALTGGCANERVRTAASPSALSQEELELNRIRAENELLQAQVASTGKQVESLKRELSAEQEKQRRFRETMTTNFDLLEQSVALSLAKTLKARETSATPEMTPPPAVRPSAPPAAPATIPPAAIEKTARASSQPKAAPSAPKPGPTPEPPLARTRPAPAATPPVTLAHPLNPGRSEAAPQPQPGLSPPASDDGEPQAALQEDPDLSQPAHPRQLSAHPEAKPLYEKAFSYFARQEFDQSIVLFEDFLRRFPNDHYSDNAQFWVGESYFRLGRMEQAETAYRNVLRHYEHRSTLDGYKTPDAIYRLGQTLMQRNEQRLARTFFESAVARFPTSSAGRRAQQELNTPATAAATAAN
ncbi:MAG: tetratricopeptide repeat protein [Deltaproteobacteria bacterium]|nr:tetratricopeptide repeat protein [Deltaproteobacteria bacterium]